MKHELFPESQLSTGEIRAVRVDGVAVAVLRTPDGRVHALRDICSHHRARLSLGELQPRVVSDRPGTYAWDDENYVLRCPWHGYEFDVQSGHCVADPEGHRVRAYAVSIEDGMIVLER
jgi:nitrite reductase (NADH) small subunit